jgi:ATP-binding cassette subfamily B protein
VLAYLGRALKNPKRKISIRKLGLRERAGDDPKGRPTRSLNPLMRLAPFVLRYPWRLLATIGFLLVSTLSGLVIPSIAGGLIDNGFTQHNLAMVSTYGWYIIAAAAVMGVAAGARFYFISNLGERVLTDLRRALFEHMLTLDAVFFDNHRVGDLTSRLNGDVGTIRGAIGSTLSMVLRGSITIIGSVAMMYLTSPYLTLAVIVIVPSIVIPLVVIGRRLRHQSRRIQDTQADMAAQSTEALGATRTIKSFVQETMQAVVYGARAEESYNAELDRLWARSILVAVSQFTASAALVVLIWWGAKAVFDKAVTVGELAQFMIYALMASNSLGSISELWGTLQSLAGATERITEILDTEPEIRGPANPARLPEPPLGTISFEGVRFAYHSRQNDIVLHDIGFAVKKGETVALVGPSGAGKSTIFSLVQRFYDVNAGTIRLDGVDIRTLDPRALRQRFAYVEQEPTIFAGTIADNIRFGKPDATEAEIHAAAEAALVAGFVAELQDGYDSIVGERGIMLSGGQKQRLAIARALLKNAPILLLDEATSALDAQSERLVQTALENLMAGRTTLVIAHRLATIRDADRILVLERGRIIDEGTHEQLVEKGGRYADLARLQFRLDLEAQPAAE